MIGLYRFDRPKLMILMLPVCEIRMFSTFRSGAKVRDRWSWMDEVLTPMDDIVVMTITECTTYLPRKLPGHAFLEAFVVDDVVEHLATIYVLENHVIIFLVNDHLAHAANVGMMEEH